MNNFKSHVERSVKQKQETELIVEKRQERGKKDWNDDVVLFVIRK